MSSATAPLAPSAPIGRRRPTVAGIKRQIKEVPQRVWTLPIIAVVIYLWVIHSFKAPIASFVIVGGLIGVFASGKRLMGSEPMKWYAIYLAYALLTLPMSLRPLVSWTAWVDSLKILLIMFLTLNAIQTKKQHRLVTLAWLGMFALYPVRGTLLNFVTGQSSFGRYAWNFTFSNFNDLAALTLFPLALALDRLRTPDHKWIKLSAFAGLLVLPFIVIITQSRGGMLGSAGFLLFMLARSRYRLRLAVAVAIMGIGAFYLAPKSVWDRVSGMSNLTSTETIGEADSSAEQRFLILQVAGTVIANNPLFGVGIGAYGYAHAKYARTNVEWNFARGRRDSHNTYLHVMAESGLIGFCLFTMIFVTSVRELMRTAKAAKASNRPEDKELADRCQAYQAAYVGFAICAVFGSLETMVFPFLLVSLISATTNIYGYRAQPDVRRPKNRARQPNALAPQPGQPRAMPR